MHIFIKKACEWIWIGFSSIFKICVNVILWTIALCVIILTSPIFLLRLFVRLLSFFRSDLHEIIDLHSSLLATDDLNGNPVVTIISSSIYKGNIDIEEFRKLVKEKVSEVKTKGGQLKNAKLQQYPYQWMGFMFWKWEDKFDLSEHVYYYQPNNKNSTVSKDEILKLESELTVQSFKCNKSPWEIIVIRNVEWEVEGQHSMIMYRFHHCLCDGFSFMKNMALPLSSKNDGAKLEQFMATPTKSPKHFGIQQFFTTAKMLISFPWDSLKYIADIQDQNYWKNSGYEVEMKYVGSLSEGISMALLKEIKNIHNVGITSLIFSGFAAGIRHAMLKKNGKVPEYIHCMVPIPMPGHPEHLSNHFSGVYLRLPLGEPDPIKRLKVIQENFENLKTSLLPLLPHYYMIFVGGLFPSLIRSIKNNIRFAAVLGSSFPGPKNKYSTLDHDAVDIYFTVGPSFDPAPVMVTSTSYCDTVRMRIALSTTVLENQTDIEDMQKAIQMEYALLKSCAKPKNEV